MLTTRCAALALAASIGFTAAILSQNQAELWINHDKPQSQAQKHSPQFYA